MALTDVQIRNAKKSEKPYKLPDGKGLYLYVSTAGGKSWRVDYAYFGKRKTLTLGVYPALGLSDARTRRDEAKKKLSEGLDPSLAKKREQLAAKAAAGNTFGLIADEFIAKLRRDKRADPTIDKNTWMLKVLAKKLSPYPITQISAKDVLDVLNVIEKSGRIESALATRSAIGRVFRFAIATARAENDPTSALRGALQRHVPVSHAALTTRKELGGLMRAIYGYDGWPSLVAALKIQALCFARPGETRSMEWSELDFENAIWTIPAAKTKMRREHHVPLSRQAIEVIKHMKELFEDKPQVFPSMMSGKTVLSENSMNSALRRMGVGEDEHTAHGFRSSASSILNESSEFSPDAIEAQLAHLDTREVRRVYNRATYWNERVKMMQWWADMLDEERTTTPIAGASGGPTP
ncbi:tyrosine-type recombinase/integrase [Rhizobium ruizarguesonis]|uniref:tyrosine-type recombinase/integrase n=1 Tax=Rhizobium ruizarguesonis TaxID=2081791 RepID=UPI001A9831FD|nr:integrase arm-type DNA-binding domain-containing protein [Rhizobium ruizarguesonis]MBY5891749.1 integrase arm-type DNA-binding domain-containing protein [Rhizobium leguminosarum]QSZ01541.1 integrase arm-type DNA-binding domain-containing protein [Rhizobium ruizarguesonis]